MPIISKIEIGNHRPAFVCDHCGREIEHADQGNAWYSMEKEGAILFSHRIPDCDNACEARLPPGLAGFINLDTWLVYVVNNLQPELELFSV